MEPDDLFSGIREERLAARAPLAARMRPRSLDEVVGQEHLVGAGAPLRVLIESDRCTAVILHGPPGTGKTTIAELIASHTAREFVRLSAVTSGVKDVREVIESARNRLVVDGRGTVVFIDEIHRFNVAQQDALLHAVEQGVIALVGATTENPSFSVNPALRSRSTVFTLRPVGAAEMVPALHRALAELGATADEGVLESLARKCNGDMRQALTCMEVAMTLAAGSQVRREHTAAALQVAVNTLGADTHYDLASAFIKSMRAGEVDVALHWLAVMVESGEDPRFIARRLVIFASEDVGMADATALPVAVAAADALDRVGMPEGLHHLAHAVVHLSLAPKSRAVTDAVAAALTQVRSGSVGQPPPRAADPAEHRPRGTTVPIYYRGEPGRVGRNDGGK